MNNILAQLNSVPMYAICGGIIAFVAVVCVIFLVRSYRAGLAIGIDPARMKRAITSSATFSVLPSVGILLGVIALSGSLGTPWPWLRLSVIGALHYETQVAQAAAEQVGMHALSAAEMTPQGFTTIALLMSVCIMWGMILSIFFNKRYLKRLGNDGAKSASGVGFGDSAMTAMFIGLVCAYIGSYIGAFVSGEGLFTWHRRLDAADRRGRVGGGDGAVRVSVREKEHGLAGELLHRWQYAHRHGGGRARAAVRRGHHERNRTQNIS